MTRFNTHTLLYVFLIELFTWSIFQNSRTLLWPFWDEMVDLVWVTINTSQERIEAKVVENTQHV